MTCNYRAHVLVHLLGDDIYGNSGTCVYAIVVAITYVGASNYIDFSLNCHMLINTQEGGNRNVCSTILQTSLEILWSMSLWNRLQHNKKWPRENMTQQICVVVDPIVGFPYFAQFATFTTIGAYFGFGAPGDKRLYILPI